MHDMDPCQATQVVASPTFDLQLQPPTNLNESNVIKNSSHITAVPEDYISHVSNNRDNTNGELRIRAARRNTSCPASQTW
jgi:hypothetical protein